MSSRPPQSSRPPVTAVVLASSESDVAATIRAIGEQVYGADHVLVVGVDGPTDASVARVETVAEALDAVDRTHAFVWFVTAGAIPDPGALGALISESSRIGAGIAGSKIMADGSDHLLEVGMATDVFGVPYSGLDADEIDAGQYDVVRDVGWVSSVSMLVRRDLLAGLGGPDPDLAPGAAAMDFCQRARLRGARVVVVPSAVVAAKPAMVDDRGWRERAGQLRAVTTAYSVLTLLWVLPLRFLIGLVEAVVAPFVGRWTLFAWVRAWVWYLATIVTTANRRSGARLGTPSPDEEFFRFQVRGSARLRTMGVLVARSLRDRLPHDDRFTLAGLGRDLRRPGIVAAVVAGLFALLATRSMWSGLPVVGFLAPLGEEAGDAITAYAGGWNPSGLGSGEPVEPLIGVLGAFQWLLFGNPRLTIGVVSLGAVIAAVLGMVRLLRIWGIGTAPAIGAGVVLIAGPATKALAGETALGAIVATALMPWAVRSVTAAWPDTWLSRSGRLAAVGAVSALLASFSPLVLVAVVFAVFGWMIFGASRGRRVGLLAVIFGVVVAAVTLRPWVQAVDVDWYLTQSSAFWRPGPALLGFLGVVVVGSVLFAPGFIARAAVWGSFIGVAGAIVARLDEVGIGRQPELAGLAAVAFGSAVVVGAALEGVTRTEFDLTGVARVGIGVGAAAALVVVASTASVLLGGRLGLPGGTFADMVNFVAAAEVTGEARVLLLGDAPDLPGPARDVDGAVYRLVDAPAPRLASVRPVPNSAADRALETVLREIASGSTQRAGEALAPFGIRWIIIAGESPFEPVLNRQLDMRPLRGLRQLTFVSDVDAARAVTGAGDVWQWDGVRYVGTPLPGGRVVVAEAADERWGPPPWEAEAWAGSVDASTGTASFTSNPARSQSATLSLGLFLLVAVAGIGMRKWR